MQKVKNKRDQTFSASQRLIIGLLLLLPLLLVSLSTHLLPATRVFASAQQDNALLRESRNVDNENYERLAEDELFAQSINNVIPYAIVRILIVAIIPALIGGLIGAQPKTGRRINRLLLSLGGVLIVPIAIGTLWRVYWGPFWGREESPVLNESLMLVSPEGATNSLLLLDALLMMAIACVVGGTIFIAVMRGYSRLKAGIAVGLIGVIVAGASGVLVFDLPYVLTRGGPANSTTTYVLQAFMSGLQRFELGYASAQVSYLIWGAILTALLVGLITILFKLRIVPIQPETSQPDDNNLFSVVSIPLIVLIIAPLVGLMIWGANLASQYEAYGRINEMVDWASGATNSTIPWLVIWFVHLPITFMAGLSLGFFRPFGRIGTHIAFLLILMVTLIPTEALMFEWFVMMREMDMVNQLVTIGLPWVVNGFSLLGFKLLFDGTYYTYHDAVASGESNQLVFSNRVILPGLLFALVVGIVMSFISSQSTIWNIISQTRIDNQTSLVLLIQAQMQLASESDMITGAAVQVIWENVILFLILFGAMHVFILERFRIEAGTPMIELETESSVDDMVDDPFTESG